MNNDKNFYEILGIDRNATNEDIRKAYHNLARRYHPDKNEHVDAEKMFKQVGAAYKVLSDPIKRAVYDRDLPAEERSRKQRRRQDPDFYVDVPLTLDEVITGCTKLCTFDRQEIQPDGSIVTVKKSLKIDIRPGCPTNKKIIFYKEGFETPNRIPANIVVITRDVPHPVFTRKGSNILYEAIISLRQALCGTVIQVPTLQGFKTVSTHGSVIQPGSTCELPGLGLPTPNGKSKGNLVVCYLITFPDRLSIEKITTLEFALPP